MVAWCAGGGGRPQKYSSKINIGKSFGHRSAVMSQDRNTGNNATPEGQWSLQNTIVAVAADSPLILKSVTSLSKAVEGLQSGEISWEADECYVFSQSKLLWYRLEKKDGAWSLENCKGSHVVDTRLVLEGTSSVSTAVEQMNAGARAL